MTWRAVTKADPCPICQKPDWCGRTDDGSVRCMRQGDPPAAWRLVSDDGEGRVFRNGQAAQITPQRNVAVRPKPPPIDRGAEAKRYARALTAELGDELADVLGVGSEFLADLYVGWCEGRSAWTFPQVDAKGRVVGVLFRDRQGGKKTGKGHNVGLFVPRGLGDSTGPKALVEGPTDVLACLSVGIPALGRPSNRAGVDMLAELLDDAGDVIVVGENDEKDDGSWPGRDGAQAVARELSRRWGRPVAWTLPPDGAKDLRVWIVGHRDQLGAAEAGRRLLAMLREAAETIDPAAPMDPYHDGRESMLAVRKMARQAEGLRDSAIDLADAVAEWFARRGDAQLTKPNGDSVDYPVGYVAGALGVSRQQFYRLRDHGRVRRLLSPSGDTYGPKSVTKLVTVPAHMPEGTLRPVMKLLPEWPQGKPPPDDTQAANEIHTALETAAQMRKAENDRAQALGRRPKKLTGRDVAAAVGELLPESKPAARPTAHDDELAEVAAVFRFIAQARAAAVARGDLPRLLVVALDVALALADLHDDDIPRDLARGLMAADGAVRQSRMNV